MAQHLQKGKRLWISLIQLNPKIENAIEAGEESMTATAEAVKKAVVGKTNNAEKATTGNSDVSYGNSENLGKDKITNQNYVSDIVEK